VVDVVNIKYCKDFGTKEGDVYIGRKFGHWPQSVWMNPYRLDYNDLASRNLSCDRYEAYFVFAEKVNELSEEKIQAGLRQHFLRNINHLDIHNLLGAKRLGCWCKPQRCHGDYLKKRIEELL
jgi:hypothetical protein